MLCAAALGEGPAGGIADTWPDDRERDAEKLPPLCVRTWPILCVLSRHIAQKSRQPPHLWSSQTHGTRPPAAPCSPPLGRSTCSLMKWHFQRHSARVSFSRFLLISKHLEQITLKYMLENIKETCKSRGNSSESRDTR